MMPCDGCASMHNETGLVAAPAAARRNLRWGLGRGEVVVPRLSPMV